MKVTRVEILVAGAGWRNFNFVKVITDEGLTGWADFSQGNVGGAIAPLVEHMGRHLVGKDPRQVQPAIEELRRRSWGVSIGAAARAIGPLENALVDIKAKALGIPVHEMLGAHCATRSSSTGRIAAAITSPNTRPLASTRSARSTTSNGWAHGCATPAITR